MKKLIILFLCIAPLFALAQPCATINSVNTSNNPCFGLNIGSMTVAATSNFMPIDYTLQPGNITNQTGLYNNLIAGSYTVTSTDANLCSATSIVNITQPFAALTISSVTTTNVNCNGGADGTISMFSTGGTMPLTFNIVPTNVINTNGQFTNLSAGCYTVTVTDANNCSANTVVCVTEPPLLLLGSALLSNQNACDIDTLDVLAIGGSFPHTYSISPTVQQFSSGTFEIFGGLYTVTVTDANGCTATSSVNNSNQAITLTSSQIVQPTCGLSDGSITANISAGPNTVTYNLNPGNLSNTTGIFNNLSSGQYTLSAQAASCNGVVDSFLLTGKLTPYPLTNNQNTFTGTAPTNGTAPYTYTLNGNNIPAPQSGLRCTGIDTFKITDAGGCTFDTTFSFIAGNNFPAINLNKSITPSTCALTNDGQIIYAPSAPLIFDWIANTSVFGSNASSLNNLTADTYVTKLINTAGDCIQDTSLVTALGTNCGNIIGTAYYDTLSNCQLDINEVAVPNATVTLNPGNIQRITNANGAFEFLGLPYGSYTISVDTNVALNQYPICNNLQSSTLSASVIHDTLDFAYEQLTNVDIYVFSPFTFLSPAAPPYSAAKTQQLFYGSNNLTTGVDVNLWAILDSIIYYDSASIVPTSINGDTLFWNLSNVTGQNNVINIYYDNLTSLSINSSLPFTAIIEPQQPIVGNWLQNDTSTATFFILASWDPNDKQVSPKGLNTPGYIELSDSVLTYLVRFQNTGTTYAYNISIEDTISNRLDMNSFQVLDASHSYLVERNNNAINFQFDNIMLPDSNADEPNSHGYILYQIKQDATNQLGDVIENTAHIYFDYNAAVVTNTTINTLGIPVGPSSVKTIVNDQFIIYPNPADSKVFIQALEKNEINSIRLFDMMGREVNIKPINIHTSLVEISTSELNIGIYLLYLNGTTIKLIKE